MASKFLNPALRLSKTATAPVIRQSSRTFKTSSRLLEVPSSALPMRRPIGAFRGGMFGFLLGSTVAGAAVYYYILDEYKVSNELLTEDIYVRYCI
jgi:hypothetical protein